MQLVNALSALAKERNATPAQLAIAWVLTRGEDILPLVGARRRDRLAESIKAIEMTLTPDDIALMEAAIPAGAAAGERYDDHGMAMLDSEKGYNGAMVDDMLISGVFDQAAQRYRSIAFDRPGFGHSERPRSGTWTASAQAALLPATFALLGVERPIGSGTRGERLSRWRSRLSIPSTSPGWCWRRGTTIQRPALIQRSSYRPAYR